MALGGLTDVKGNDVVKVGVDMCQNVARKVVKCTFTLVEYAVEGQSVRTLSVCKNRHGNGELCVKSPELNGAKLHEWIAGLGQRNRRLTHLLVPDPELQRFLNDRGIKQIFKR